MELTEQIHLIAEASDDRKAEDIVILDMKNLSSVSDYFMICHGSNERQVQAIAKSIKEKLEKHDIHVQRMEGYEQARWILLDIGSIVCHVFHKDERYYYNLERLWGDASRIKLPNIEDEG